LFRTNGFAQQIGKTLICINTVCINTIHVTASHGPSCATIEVI